jgi:pSer/pThr/pTyr-binding forkhead associated (FHA) protein
LAEVGPDVSRVATFIGPVLNAQSRCEISSYYIQAVTTGRTAFLITNLSDMGANYVTEVANSWLIGRNSSCAIAVMNRSISRCHAVIGCCTDRGFYIMDLGSSNGTRVNRRRLVPQEQRFLQDGDLIELSSIQVEFFVIDSAARSRSAQDTQI